MKLPAFKFDALIHSSRKERSISLATAQWSWFLILASASATVLMGGAYAMYVFTTIDQVGESIIVDPPQTTSYKGALIDTVLERYRTKSDYFDARAIKSQPVSAVPPAEAIRAVPSEIGTTTAESAIVASTTGEGVE